MNYRSRLNQLSKASKKCSAVKDIQEREQIYIAVSFDQRRFTTVRVNPNETMQFNEIILFEFDLGHEINSNDEIKFDAALMEHMK